MPYRDEASRAPFERARDEAFERLASDQRGEPEQAMLRLQHAQIAQEYGWLCEHVGDLTHRMSEKFSWFQGNYGNVSEKVDKTLRRIEWPIGVLDEVDRQIKSNIAFNLEPESAKYRKAGYPTDFHDAKRKLRDLGKAYADEHRKLVVWNRPQWLARESAIALGEMRLWDCRRHLSELKSMLVKGREAWAEESGVFVGKPYPFEEGDDAIALLLSAFMLLL